MKVLQITSDWKWTGPAEPMLQLALGLRERGHDLVLACPETPRPRAGVAEHARAAGFPPALVLEPARGFHPWRDRRDGRRLVRYLAEQRFDVVHAWHSRDHALALLARRGSGARLVRTLSHSEPIAERPWNRWLFGPGTDGLWCVSPGLAQRNAALRGGRPAAGGFGAVDLERFQPAPQDPDVRRALGLGMDDRVVGIVARMQPRRRFDLLLDAAERLFARDPRARLLVVGRGTHREAVAEDPARRRGLGNRVVFAGYRGEDYLETIRAIDVFTLLVPGTDGTCRAVLEAAACAIPAVVTRRGALPEIVADGETGFVVDEDPDALAAAWERLLHDDTRRALGEAAARRARTLFSPTGLAEGVEALYRAALEKA